MKSEEFIKGQKDVFDRVWNSGFKKVYEEPEDDKGVLTAVVNLLIELRHIKEELDK